MKNLTIGIIQFAVDASENSHLFSEHPLGSISRMMAEILSERLNYIGIYSSVAKLIVTKPEENTYKQLIYTDILPMETARKVFETENFDFLLYGKISFEKQLKIEFAILDAHNYENIWRREFNSTNYNFAEISERIISETLKILNLDNETSILKELAKYSGENLKAWGWYAVSFEEDLNYSDKEAALYKAIEYDINFTEASLRLAYYQLSNKEKVEKIISNLENTYKELNYKLLNYYGNLAFINNNYFVSSIFYEYSLKINLNQSTPFKKLLKSYFELENKEKLAFWLDEYQKNISEENLDFENLPYYLLLCNRNEEALKIAEKAIFIYKDNPKLLANTAFMYTKFERFTEAEELYEKSFTLSYNDKVLEDWSAAILKSKNYNKAIEIINKYKEDLPYNSGVECNLALAYMSLDKEDKALKILEKTVKVDKENAMVQALLGNIYMKQKSYPRAQKYLSLAHKLQPENPNWLKSLGDLFYYMGDKQEALKYYENVIKTSNSIKMPQYLYLKAENLKNESKLKEALETYYKAFKLDEQFLDPLEKIALIFFEDESYDKAIEFFQKYLEKDDKNPDIWFNLHKVYTIKSKGFFKKNWKIKAEEALKKYESLKS